MSMGTITKWISALGQSIQFVAWWAHFGVAALICGHVGKSDPLWTLIVVVVAAALKEFVYDAHFETDPVQTAADNWQDFSGWVAGAVLGLGFAVGWW